MLHKVVTSGGDQHAAASDVALTVLVLFGAFLVAAVLDMTETPAGFATNHLADFVGPAWLYIVFLQ